MDTWLQPAQGEIPSDGLLTNDDHIHRHAWFMIRVGHANGIRIATFSQPPGVVAACIGLQRPALAEAALDHHLRLCKSIPGLITITQADHTALQLTPIKRRCNGHGHRDHQRAIGGVILNFQIRQVSTRLSEQGSIERDLDEL